MIEHVSPREQTICLMLLMFVFLIASVLDQTLLAADTPGTGGENSLYDRLDDSVLRSVQLVGPNIAYAAGDAGLIRKTTDAGLTWQMLKSPVSARWNDLQFLTDQIGWIAGGTAAFDGGSSRAVLLHTRDGGQTWKQLQPAGMGLIFSIQFFDLQHGIVCGLSSSRGLSGIWRTSDGGETWGPLPATEAHSWRAGDFAASTGGVVAGAYGDVAMVGGNRLIDDRSLNLGNKRINDLCIDESAAGWLVGQGGLLRYSPGGATWQDPPAAVPDIVKLATDFQAVSQYQSSVWIVGQPGTFVLHSADAGKSWSLQPTGAFVGLNAIHFSDSLNGCAVGELGTILWTSDGGKTWRSYIREPRRLAALHLTKTTTETDLCLLARYAGHAGYRCGTIAVCPTETDRQRPHDLPEDLKLEFATAGVAGQLARVGWMLPLDLPELDRHQSLLIRRWQNATDDRLQELVLAHLVREIRVYRPSLMLIDQSAADDQAGQLLKTAILNAVRFAADPTWMPVLSTELQLPPWQVVRLLERNFESRGGDCTIDHNEYLAYWNQSARMTASPLSPLLGLSFAEVPLTESFVQIPLERSESAEVSPIHLQDLFTGIILGPGSPARRCGLTEGSSADTAGEKQAREQRNFSAYIRTQLQDEQKAGELLAQLGPMLQQNPAHQAVQQLLELAREYEQAGQWDYYEAMLMQAVENYPQQQLTSLAASELILLWCSAEMTGWRLSSRNTKVIQRQLDSQQMRSQFQEILQTAFQDPSTPAATVQPQMTNSLLSQPVTPGSQLERTQWQQTWQDRALSVYAFLQQSDPDRAGQPDIQLAIASLLRQRGATRGWQEIYQPYLNGFVAADQAGNPLHEIATGELWLQARNGITPRNHLSAYVTEQPPYLDGLLSDPCWQQADEISLTSTDNPLANVNSSALIMLTHDAEYLYVAGTFPRHPDLPTDLPTPGKRTYDADLSGFDRFTLRIDTNRDYGSAYELTVDQRGWTSDRCWKESRWNPRWFVACQGDIERWRIEVAIPKQELLLQQTGNSGPEQIWSIQCTRQLPGIGRQSWPDNKSATVTINHGLLHLR